MGDAGVADGSKVAVKSVAQPSQCSFALSVALPAHFSFQTVPNRSNRFLFGKPERNYDRSRLPQACRSQHWFDGIFRDMIGTKAKSFLQKLPSFSRIWQSWHSKAPALSALSAVAVMMTASQAYALSSACMTLNSKSGTTSYSQTFAASEFDAGETLTVSFTDNGGDPKTVPEINSAQIRLNNANSSTVYYRYSSYTGSAGAHSGSHTALNTAGLSIQIKALTYLSAVSIVCSGPALPPTLSGISPASGPTAGGTSVSLTGTDFTGATAVTIGGTAATGVTVNSATSITATTPAHAPGTVDVVVTTPGGTATLTNAFSYAAPTPPVANAVSAAVAANSTNNAITLSITGGTPTSVAVATQAAHGTAIASGASIVYSPASGYYGADSFLYTATNADGTSAPATVNITVSAPMPTLSNISPASGPTAGGTSVTLTGTNFSGASDVIFGGVPATSVTVNNATSITATTPAHATGSVDVVVSTPGGTATLTGGFSYLAPVLPVANQVSATVAANSANNAVTLSITGGVATSVAVASQAAHGTATASGTSIVYSPDSGYYGADSFTYTATNADGTSAPAIVSITVQARAPTLSVISPASGPTAGGTSVTLTGTNLTGATGVTIGGIGATGVAINSATSITVTTPAHAAGSADITVTTPGGTAALPGGYTYQAEPVVITPPSGALPDARIGVSYNQLLSLTGGTAPFAFSLSGPLPAGLVLDPTTGAISGTPTSSGKYTFTVAVTDATNVRTSVNYAMTVTAPPADFAFTPSEGAALKQAMVGEDYSQPISARGGTGPLTYSLASGSLPKGMVLNITTGELTGPLALDAEDKEYVFSIEVRDDDGAVGSVRYTLAVRPRSVTVTDKVVDVEPGTSPTDTYLNRGATGGPFVAADATFVEPSNAGTARIIQGQLAQVGPAAPVGWYLQFTPNPAYSGKVRVGFRLTNAQGVSDTGTVTYNVAYNVEQVAEDTNQLVQAFVERRQDLIASTIHVPGLMDRRRMGTATDPVTARVTPSKDGLSVSFSSSLAQIESARDSADHIRGSAASPFNVWIDGAVLAHNNKDINGGKWGNFAMLNLGADYLLNERALLGLSFHYDHMTDPTDENAELKGNGWLFGPYTSLEIGSGVFWNANLLYGGSSNTVDMPLWDGTFDTQRWLADTSLEGQWNLSNDTVLTPKMRAVYFIEKVEDYSISNDAGDAIGISGFDEEQLRISLGAEIARSFTLENGSTMTPALGLTGGFSGLDGAGAFGTVRAGLSIQTADLWALDAGLLLNFEGDGSRSIGGKIGAARQF